MSTGPASVKVSSGKYSTEQLRDFYFSKATSYQGYKKKQATGEAPAPPARAVTPSDVNVSISSAKQVPSPVTSPNHDTTAAKTTSASPEAPATTAATPAPAATTTTTKTSVSAAGSAVQAAKDKKATRGAGPPISVTTSSGAGFSSESVSPDYITFLRQQQDLVKVHNRIDEILHSMLSTAAERRNEHIEGVSVGGELLSKAETSTDWNWKSKYTKDALVQDAGLQVPFNELRAAEDIPNIIDLQHQHQQIVKLRQDHCGKDSNPQYRLALENGIRRFERLVKEFSSSQLDATPVVRLSDNLLVQLDHLLTLSPLSVTLQEVNNSISVLSNKQKACMEVRDQAHDDGEMGIAQQETFRLVDLSEELASTQVSKISLLNQALEENTVSSAVRDAYAAKAMEETAAVEAESTDLRTRCEIDLAKLYQLKKSVDDTEAQMSDRWTKECEASNSKLNDIVTKQKDIWSHIEMLTKQLSQLEAERHSEMKHRVDEKVRDETRRIEYETFTNVATQHATTLDRTMRNCDTNIHCAKLMAEFLQSGFYTIQKDLGEKKAEIDAALLDAHKCHLAVFRSLLFTLSDLEYKKERRVEEVGEAIQTAHIQQALCNDSLNPNAKKYSDAKKELLRLRDEVELEVRDIRERMTAAVNQFKPSEVALVTARVEHTHPVQEMEDRRLNMRMKMVEYRAMSLGTVSSEPIKHELDMLRKNLDDSRRVIASSSRNSTRLLGNNTTSP